jgi:hypothetical protein
VVLPAQTVQQVFSDIVLRALEAVVDVHRFDARVPALLCEVKNTPEYFDGQAGGTSSLNSDPLELHVVDEAALESDLLAAVQGSQRRVVDMRV